MTIMCYHPGNVQGDMEKMVRKSKNELREKEAEVAKLKEGREHLVKTIEEMQEIIRRHDSDSTTTSKSITAMQAVSQASMERLAKLEAELSGKTEEVLNQKRALDTAWAEIAELKRAAAEVRAERDDVMKNKGQTESKIAEREALVRDLEQREAVLRATNKQLQDSLQRQMSDSSTREERLREEILDARKRWQDAISNRESLAAEVSQSTAPLLRQISNLQESIKTKTEAWQGIENSLLERALRAESLAESCSYKMKLIEEKYSAAAKLSEELSSRLHERDSKLQDLELASERWVRQEREFVDRLADLETRLATESTQRLNAQSAMREAKDALDNANKQAQLKLSMLNSEIEDLNKQLEANKPVLLEQERRIQSASKARSEQGALHEQNAVSNAMSSRNSSATVNNSYLSSEYNCVNSFVIYASADFVYCQMARCLLSVQIELANSWR